MKTALLAAVAAISFGATSANAVTVNWANITDFSPVGVGGTISTSQGGIGFEYVGPNFFVQNNGGTNYWTEPDANARPYTGGSVDNAPGDPDIIALGQGGRKTILFSQAVSDVYLALVSWNGNSGVFDQAFEVISQGCGFWGCGTFTNVTTTSFVANGELHGIIRFTGDFNSVTFTDQTEGWHGIQIGIGGLANVVPEPASWAMMIAGFGLVGAVARRRETAVLA